MHTLTFECGQCGEVFNDEDPDPECPVCGSQDVEVL